MNICGKCTNETYSFLTIDTKLLAQNTFWFRTNLLDLLFITDDKIKAKQAQYVIEKQLKFLHCHLKN